MIVLKNITARYITAKYIQVFIHAPFENTNSNFVIFASNNFATNTDINCDANIPITIPAINDNIPTNIVSNKIIFDICLFPIPSVIYIPNSFFLRFIKKLFAYTIKSPNITATNTDINSNILIIIVIISLCDCDTCNMAC